MISVYDIDNECCGCAGCSERCPVGAISMESDNYGFRYPKINQNKCIDCSLCRNSCNFKKSTIDKEPIECYAGQRMSNIIDKSASGGIFAELASEVIRKQGIVFGCVYKKINNKLIPIIEKAETWNEVIPMLGSKYVQSYTSKSYKAAEEELKKGRLVLFSGLPCQIAGLKGFLRKDYDNLIMVDIICHGTPSVSMFNGFLEHIEKKKKRPLISFNFREKSVGWGNFSYSYKYKDPHKKGNNKTHKQTNNYKHSVYYRLFLNASIYRDSCYNCPFASSNRPGDITIGDCWGIDKEFPQYELSKGGILDFSKGVSAILINSIKGKQFFKENSGGLLKIPYSFQLIKKYNHQLYRPSYDSPFRNQYFSTYRNQGYSGLIKKYYKIEWRSVIKEKLIEITPTWILLLKKRLFH